MSTESSTANIETLIARLLAGEPREICDNLGQVTSALRANEVPPESVPSIGEKLSSLALHSKSKVRLAVVGALEHLRDDSFLETISRLASDSNGWVKTAAMAVIHRRTEAEPVDALKDGREAKISRTLHEIEERFGTSGRRLALRLAAEYSGTILREAYHELASGMTSLETAAVKVKLHLSRPPSRFSQKACQEQHLRMMGRLALPSWSRRLTAPHRNRHHAAAEH